MDLTIIIPSFNTKDLLDRCLSSIYRSLKDSRVSYEVVVVDNASTDGSIELLKTKYPRVIKILNKFNVGYGKANNQAIKKAQGTYVLLLNSDIEVLDQAIELLYECAKVHKGSFVGGKLLNEDRSPQPSCGPGFTLPTVAAMLFFRGDMLGISRYSPNHEVRVDWISGACLISTKNTFEDVGLFDETIFMYMEEIDLLYRAKKKGYTTFFCPDGIFIHSGAASSGSRKRPVVNIYQGLLYFYRKHRPIMEVRVLQFLLRLKAVIALYVGKILGNHYLVSTYEEALQLVR